MATFYENKRIPITTGKGQKLSDAAHLHNHLEIVYLLDGATKTVCENREDTMESGDIFIAFPNQVHCYPKIGNGYAKHFLFIFSPTVCTEFKDLFHRMIPTASVIRKRHLDPELPALAQKIHEENEKNTPYKEVITRGYLIAFLGKLFRSMEFREEKQSDGTLLKSILNYCNKHYTEPLSLDRLSAELNVGQYHSSHIFGKKLKISFPDYVNGLRINDAIRKLTADPDCPITDIAYDCGFSSTRTFNRAFVKYTGISPREYREQNRYKTVEPINFYIKD
ncbi:MAG: helix-turn-helix transcriptional regulator [Clostridia bacterium]|nr:helix-turn-helix transcriptional regulator [Clostridia bacterium]